MATVNQTQQMKDAYGERFSQTDLTVPEENVVPQPLMTETSEEGDLAFAREKLVVPAQRGNRTVPRSTVPKAKPVR